jgi:hypothetical protein
MKNRPMIDALLKRTDVSQVNAGGARENTFVAGVTLMPGYRISRSMAQSLWETVKATDSELHGVILNITDGYRYRTYENVSKIRGQGRDWTEYDEAW